MSERPLSDAFVLVAELGLALGVAPLNKHEGCWRYRLGSAPAWEFAVNGHSTPQPDPFGSDIPVEPFHCYAQFNGWPFAVFNAFGGTFGAGEVANEDAFIAAVVGETGAVHSASASKMLAGRAAQREDMGE